MTKNTLFGVTFSFKKMLIAKQAQIESLSPSLVKLVTSIKICYYYYYFFLTA